MAAPPTRTAAAAGPDAFHRRSSTLHHGHGHQSRHLAGDTRAVDDLADLIRLGMYSGARIEELCALKVTDWLKGPGAIAGVKFSHEGYGEAEARKATGIKDDKKAVEVTAHRKVVFRITEVDGKAAPENWKPTRKVIKVRPLKALKEMAK